MIILSREYKYEREREREKRGKDENSFNSNRFANDITLLYFLICYFFASESFVAYSITRSTLVYVEIADLCIEIVNKIHPHSIVINYGRSN